MALLLEVRNYLLHREPRDRDALIATDRLRLCGETMRITARLTQIMAWLLTQRAVRAGEITQDQALADPQTLADLDVCMSEAGYDASGLPSSVVDLASRSRKLYVRVARLDELARRQFA
jgi:regulator of CtrA degradation